MSYLSALPTFHAVDGEDPGQVDVLDFLPVGPNTIADAGPTVVVLVSVPSSTGGCGDGAHEGDGHHEGGERGHPRPHDGRALSGGGATFLDLRTFSTSLCILSRLEFRPGFLGYFWIFLFF